MNIKRGVLIALLGILVGVSRAKKSLLVEKVESFMNDFAGSVDFQRKIDDVEIRTGKLDSEKLVRKVADAIGKKTKEAAAAVKELGVEVEDAIEKKSYENDYFPCCRHRTDGYWDAYDDNFEMEIDFDNACLRSKSKSPKAPSVVDNMKSILKRYSKSMFQYFATQEGTVIQYPSPSFERFGEECDHENLQDWYIPAVYPGHKLVAVVFDSSDSMQLDGRHEIAHAGVLDIMNTLSPADNIALVSYGGKITRATDPGQALPCDDNKMPRATKVNIELLQKWLLAIKPSGDSSLKGGLEAAFEYFDYEGKNGERKDSDRILIVISGSTPKDDADDLVKIVKARGDGLGLGGRLVIFTYGIGSGAPHTTLQSIAAESTMNSMKKGFNYRVDDKTDMHEKASKFYEELKIEAKATAATWSTPHLDKLSQHWVVKSSVPVFASEKFEGVAAVEMPLKNLAEESVYLNEASDIAYSFVMDKEFDVMVHPFWPTLSGDNAALPSITEIETSAKIETSLLPKIRQLKNGDVVTESIPGTSRITKGLYYANYVQFDAKFSCKFVEDTPYIVCVVVAEDSDAVRIPGLSSPGEHVFTYHRFDLVSPENVCIHFGRYSSHGSAVSFSPKALTDPGRYLGEETRSDVLAYKSEVQGSESKITELARADILLTYSLDEFWQKHELDQAESHKLEYYVPWRYVGTESGIFRMTPGMEMSKGYNFMNTAWYQMSKNFPNEIVITPPHFFFDVPVISFAKAIQIDGKDGKQFHGAVGFDLLREEFYDIFHESFDYCEGWCLVLDRSGYVIYGDDDYWRPRHITEVVPTTIPKMMKRKGLLVDYKCTITTEGVIGQSSVFDTAAFGQNGVVIEDGYYGVELISGSNAIFLNISEKVVDEKMGYYCPEDLADRICSDEISCPCYHWPKFTFCSDTRNANPPPCLDTNPYIRDMKHGYPNIDEDDPEELCYRHFEKWWERAGLRHLEWLWIFGLIGPIIGVLCFCGRASYVANESQQAPLQNIGFGQPGMPGVGAPPGGMAPPGYNDAQNLPGMQQQGPPGGGFFGTPGFQQPGSGQSGPGLEQQGFSSFGANPQNQSMFSPPGGQQNQFSPGMF